MEITEVRIKLMEDSDDRLQAFCSITFDDCFVVRDLKIIEGSNGPFVAMPSRKLTSHCNHCGSKNHLRSSYCNQCGGKLQDHRAPRDPDGRTKLYADIAHPINSICREMIQNRVISEFEGEVERSSEPGYVSRYDDDYDLADLEQLEEAASPARPKPTPAPAPPVDEPAPKTKSEIQPPSTEPRPPHKSPAQQRERGPSRGIPGRHQQPTRTQKAKDEPDDDFGAGIF